MQHNFELPIAVISLRKQKQLIVVTFRLLHLRGKRPKLKIGEEGGGRELTCQAPAF